MKKIIAWILILAALAGAGYGAYQYYLHATAWRVEVIYEHKDINGNVSMRDSVVNVRKEPLTGNTEIVAQITLGEVYKVVDFEGERDPGFVWYKIEYEKDKFGWVGNPRDVTATPNLKEINNPYNRADDSYLVDYGAPVIKYQEAVYEVYDLNSINYEHLTVEDVSDYEVTHKVYIEHKSTDSGPIIQYWIQYIATDEAGLSSEKVQQVIFEVAPDESELLPFEELGR